MRCRFSKILLVAVVVLLSGCVSHQYYPSTYSDAIVYFRPSSENLKEKTIVLNAYKYEDKIKERDNDLFNHIAILLEKQGAEVINGSYENDEEADEGNQEEVSTEILQLDVTSRLAWVESSQWEAVFNAFTYGCYPNQKNRWYETEIKTQLGDDLVLQEVFKSLMVERTSWCYYAYSKISSWVSDSKTSADHLATNTLHFDRFVSHAIFKTMQQQPEFREVAKK